MSNWPLGYGNCIFESPLKFQGRLLLLNDTPMSNISLSQKRYVQIREKKSLHSHFNQKIMVKKVNYFIGQTLKNNLPFYRL